MANCTVKREFHSINSKDLANEITGVIDRDLFEQGIQWNVESQRQAVAGIIEELFDEVWVSKGKVEQYNVLFDRRNNTTTDMEKGLFFLELRYKQKNCVNVSRIVYEIRSHVVLDKAHIEPDYII